MKFMTNLSNNSAGIPYLLLNLIVNTELNKLARMLFQRTTRSGHYLTIPLSRRKQLDSSICVKIFLSFKII